MLNLAIFFIVACIVFIFGEISVLFIGYGYVGYNLDLLPFGPSLMDADIKDLIIPCLIFAVILCIIAFQSDICKMAVYTYLGGTLSVMFLQDSSFGDTYIKLIIVAILGSAIGLALYYKKNDRYARQLKLKDYVLGGILLFDGLYLDISIALETVKNESHESVYLQAAGIALLITVIVGIITFVHKKQNK